MSLVNQMLQDLEQRRTAEAGASPLGGLSASGAASVTAQSINYMVLGATVALVVAVVVALLYWFGMKQSVMTVSVAEPVVEMAGPKKSAAINPAVEIISESKARPEVQKLVSDANKSSAMSAEKTLTKPFESPLIKQPNPVVEKTEKPVLQKASRVSDLEKETSSISIRASEAESEKLLVKVSSLSEGENKSIDSPSEIPVSKTIRPLTHEQQAQIAFQDAVKLLGRGAESAAQNKLETALSIEPVHARARETLVALLLNTGRVSEAAEKLSEGLRLRPSSAVLAKMYARVLVDQGDTDAAVVVMERARPLVAADPDYYALLAVLYRGVGKHAQASQVYQQILQVRPGVAVWWMGLALSEDAMNSSAKALEAYQRALRSGGLKAEVLAYVQSRISVLAASVAEKSSLLVANDSDVFED